MDDQSRTPWVLITVLVGFVMFLTGALATAVLMRGLPALLTTSSVSKSTPAVAPAAPATDPPTARPRLGWGAPGVRVAPGGNVATLEDGVMQGANGVVVVHAGRGTLNAFPASMGGSYKFGFRAARGTRSPEAAVSLALVNGDVQNRLELNADQRQQLDAIGPIPQPSEETQDAIVTLFETYANADGDAKTAAKKLLLNAVRRDGESRAEAVEAWHVQRYELLTDEQRAAAVSPGPRKAATLPGVEQ